MGGDLAARLAAVGGLTATAARRRDRNPQITVDDVISLDGAGGLRFTARLDAPAEAPIEVMFAFRAARSGDAGAPITGTAVLPRGRTELVLDLDDDQIHDLAPDGCVALDLFGLSGARFASGGFRTTAFGLAAQPDQATDGLASDTGPGGAPIQWS